jgi:hypothetical protein
MGLIMEFIVAFALVLSFCLVIRYGVSNTTPVVREETVIFCNQKPQECKKEFEYYQLKKEVETMKENQK